MTRWLPTRIKTIDELANLTRLIAATGRPVSPGLNLPPNLRRVVRYHPLFLTDERRLANMDPEPFPADIRAVGRMSPIWQAPWLKNYYQLNPLALHGAAMQPHQFQNYLQKYLTPAAVKPMSDWLANQVHEVRPGQTLSDIARTRGLSPSALKSQNRWLEKRRSGTGLAGFDYIRPGDRIVLPAKYPVPRGRLDPFPAHVAELPLGQRQPWLRAYYEANPLARLQARGQARDMIRFANRTLR